ncbi:hypothetical protein Poly59_05640 [Rubripirellula reticaptiva]|uniref:Uncharacterized protein n=1 Tax=Rubripirellula reticaptiva TaxID=2528013 RepID=A0A5C6FAT8_9BACT|nr:hypothetical protein Poly59_05640 [Rubripirellula reticaptiva]
MISIDFPAEPKISILARPAGKRIESLFSGKLASQLFFVPTLAATASCHETWKKPGKRLDARNSFRGRSPGIQCSCLEEFYEPLGGLVPNRVVSFRRCF